MLRVHTYFCTSRLLVRSIVVYCYKLEFGQVNLISKPMSYQCYLRIHGKISEPKSAFVLNTLWQARKDKQNSIHKSNLAAEYLFLDQSIHNSYKKRFFFTKSESSKAFLHYTVRSLLCIILETGFISDTKFPMKASMSRFLLNRYEEMQQAYGTK